MDISRTEAQLTLESLPQDILRLIIKHVSGQHDLRNICGVSSLFYHIALPQLYRKIVIVCPEGFNPRLRDIQMFSRSSSRLGTDAGLRFVRHLSLFSENRKTLLYRCYHNRAYDLFTGDYLEFDSEGEPAHNSTENSERQTTAEFKRKAVAMKSDTSAIENCNCSYLGDQYFSEEDFLLFCHRLRDHSLETFSWDLGTCIPLNILSPGGYLPTHQSSLRRLHLSTSGSCGRALVRSSSLDLSNFRHLIEFSWTGLRSKNDFDALRDCLKTAGQHLQSLDLHLSDTEKWDDLWAQDLKYSDSDIRSPTFFADRIVGFQIGQRDLILSSLKSLSLSSVSFTSAIHELSVAFQIGKLQSLRLHNCPGALDLLHHVVCAEGTHRLVSLEITFDGNRYNQDSEMNSRATGKLSQILQRLQNWYSSWI